MKKYLLAAAAAGTLALAAGHALADGASVTYNISATNDYVFRGYSQTDGKAAIQGGIDVTEGSFYEGAWASNSDFGDREVDLYGGWRPTAGKFSFDVGAIYYNYNDPSLDTTELKAAVSHPLGKATVGVAFYDDIDFGKTYYYELNGSYPITDKLSVSGAVGEQSYTSSKYSTGNIGLTYAITPVWSVDARYWDTNINDMYKPTKGRFAVLLKAAF